MNKEKLSPELGRKVHNYLIKKGVETPMVERDGNTQREIEKNFSIIMQNLGLDLSDDSLEKTPFRVSRMYTREVFQGLDYQNFPKVTTVENKMKYDEMITVRRIKVMSFCEHHFVPFIGEATISYIPNKSIVGLSKINRIVNFFARRPQIQERLTEQIFFTLQYVLGTENIAIKIRANHFCVIMRGVEDINSETVTTKLGGVFLDGARNEFLNISK